MRYDTINTKQRFKIRYGENAGKIVEGARLGAWDTLQNLEKYYEIMREEGSIEAVERIMGKGWTDVHCDWKNIGDGVWITSLNCRIPLKDVEDLHVPFDRFQREIMVGSVIHYAMRDLTVARMRVDRIETGGSMSVTLHGIDLDTKKKTKNSYPHRCILFG